LSVKSLHIMENPEKSMPCITTILSESDDNDKSS